MVSMEERTEIVIRTMRMDRPTYKLLERLAKAACRSVNAEIRYLVLRENERVSDEDRIASEV